jgi:putative ABC transport system ATP-binding protein
LLRLVDLSKTLPALQPDLPPRELLRGIGLDLAAGDYVAIMGESGCGKSTLLNLIAGLDRPSGGHVELDGRNLSALDDNGVTRLRAARMGFVFQAFHVLPHLTVAENVSLPLRLLGRPDEARVAAMLEAVGLAGLGGRFPAQLSGGQLQRVAIARAVVHAPALILADEPTGNLDPETAERVLAVLQAQVHDAGAACLLVTHSAAAAARAQRVMRLTAHGVRDA